MIRLEDVSKNYGSLQVLSRVTLEIGKAEVTAIVGPSGAGKTTLLQIMGSIETPSEGKVLYDSKDIFALRDRQLAAFRCDNIGFVFQYHRLLPEFSLLENVMMPALIRGDSSSAARSRAMELIEYLHLEHRVGHRPAQMSGGECQRASVARALVNNPLVVLADEPSGSLDSANRTELHQLFFDLRRDYGQTFVIVTHDESLASDCDRIIHLRDGKIEDIASNIASQSHI